jgi:hypothetical protein
MHPAEYAKLKGGSLPPASAVAENAVPQSAAANPASPRGPPFDDDTLLTSAQTRALVGGVTTMCIWRWQRDPRVQFPHPDVVINGRNYWRRGTIRSWKPGGQQQQVA